MTLTRKRLIIIGAMIIAVIAIITAIFACGSSSDNGGSGGTFKDPNICTVTFDLVGGTVYGNKSYTVTIDKNSTVARPSEIPRRDGFVFWGWNTTGNANDPMWKFDVEKITQDMTIFAVWMREYTVTFCAEDGSFDDGENTRTVTSLYGNKITAPTVTPPDEYTELLGWYRGSTRWDFSQNTVTDDITLSAVWDLKRDIKKAFAPFRYSKTDDGYTLNGVVDQNVSELTVPSIITSISLAAFSNCHNLVSVVMPDSVTKIGEFSFQNCEKLKSVTLPSGLTSIANYTFDGCAALEDIRLPDTLTEVGDCAFRGCSSLKSIEIPSDVTQVMYSAFENCTALTS